MEREGRKLERRKEAGGGIVYARKAKEWGGREMRRQQSSESTP